ncbi:chaperone modulator CbpM [Lutimonas sp.]|uniref:chaperone modulator CbpM n=1 Tax=Lutimonas sp. TaxID=1872403 RepID=UPI003D9AFEAC
MATEKYIPVIHLCNLYQIEITFFHELNDLGLVELISKDNDMFLHEDKLYKVERIIRIHQELNVNMEGIDVVLNLLDKVDKLQNEVQVIQSRLRLYEDDL